MKIQHISWSPSWLYSALSFLGCCCSSEEQLMVFCSFNTSPVPVMLLNTFILMCTLTRWAGHGAEGWQHVVLLTSTGMVFDASLWVLWSRCVTSHMARSLCGRLTLQVNAFSCFDECAGSVPALVIFSPLTSWCLFCAPGQVFPVCLSSLHVDSWIAY